MNQEWGIEETLLFQLRLVLPVQRVDIVQYWSSSINELIDQDDQELPLEALVDVELVYLIPFEE